MVRRHQRRRGGEDTVDLLREERQETERRIRAELNKTVNVLVIVAVIGWVGFVAVIGWYWLFS